VFSVHQCAPVIKFLPKEFGSIELRKESVANRQKKREREKTIDIE